MDDSSLVNSKSETCSVNNDEDVDDGAEEDYFGDKSGRVSEVDSSSFKNGTAMDDDAPSVVSNVTDVMDTTLGSSENTSLPDLLSRYGLDYESLFVSKIVRNENGEFVTYNAPFMPSLFSNVAPVIKFITVHEKSKRVLFHYFK